MENILIISLALITLLSLMGNYILFNSWSELNDDNEELTEKNRRLSMSIASEEKYSYKLHNELRLTINKYQRMAYSRNKFVKFLENFKRWDNKKIPKFIEDNTKNTHKAN